MWNKGVRVEGGRGLVKITRPGGRFYCQASRISCTKSTKGAEKRVRRLKAVSSKSRSTLFNRNFSPRRTKKKNESERIPNGS